MSLGLLIALSLALGVAAWLFFMWTVRSGQYEDPEGAKYRMLEEDEGERTRPPGGTAGEPPPADGAAGEPRAPPDPHRGPERSP
ncbi:MAG TPA: cbb3-type cytochrome oxidase assembly protein CcoS [Anaeromyxobacter sp.]|nr:cbb3-type cytochrome oxidase assembly protein CcoS [Anaeromyxobacter sp.]